MSQCYAPAEERKGKLGDSMVNHLSIIILSFALSVSVAMADTIDATNEHPSLNTNPRFEIYPGQWADFGFNMEDYSTNRIKKLLELLKNLRSNDIEKSYQDVRNGTKVAE